MYSKIFVYNYSLFLSYYSSAFFISNIICNIAYYESVNFFRKDLNISHFYIF